jgi:catechol 2,3-dioxygenase-like lactoylglutathione lyase family enzyme
MEVNGIAHIQLSVNRFDECVAFYDQLMPYLGLRVVHRGENIVYFVGGRTGLAISRAGAQHADEAHDAMRPGLHHYCFRARSREDIDALYPFLQRIGATIVRAPEEGPWAPGYYSILFEDPDGVRVEVNHVPGKGHLGPEGRLGPGGAGPATEYGDGGLGGKR